MNNATDFNTFRAEYAEKYAGAFGEIQDKKIDPEHLTSQNEEHGAHNELRNFHGSIHAPAMFRKSAEHIVHEHGLSPSNAVNYLDSRNGRHMMDQVDHHALNKAHHAENREGFKSEISKGMEKYHRTSGHMKQAFRDHRESPDIDQ